MPVRLHPLFRDRPERRLVGVGRDEAVVERLRGQYREVRARGDELARVFYGSLFAQYPGLRPMFKTDSGEQRRKLMESLDTVMAFLDRPGEQGPYLAQLGARHAGYGARPEHYPIVSGLLADAVVAVLGDRADADTREDWAEAFGLVSDQMVAGQGGGSVAGG